MIDMGYLLALKSLLLASLMGWLGDRVVNLLGSGAEEPGFKS